jgi:protein tyrosine phosphatase (PTP) superfamily phosphohydrolase (DUF442 family)
MKRILKITVPLLLVVLGLLYAWYNNYNFRFEEISPNKVYKSALITPDRLEDFLISNNINTVIDLLDPGVQDRLNPAQQKDINKEDAAIKAINKKYGTNIRHVNIPSGQVPTKKTLKEFFEVLDDNSSYPVLIHCYHGMGRAVIYSALYRIEYENWSNEDARMKARLLPLMVDSPLHHSSFAKGREKGDFLINYIPRKEGDPSTLNRLQK